MPRVSCPVCVKQFDTMPNARGELRCPFCRGLARAGGGGDAKPTVAGEHVPEMKRCYACDGKVHYYAKKCPHCGQIFGDLDFRSTSDALPDANPKQLLLSTGLATLGFACFAAALSKTWLLFIPAAGLFYAAYRINAGPKRKR